jgi:hypothetical protein
MLVRARAHRTQLPILPLQSHRLLKTWQPAHLPQAVAANKATEEEPEIREVADVAENREGVEGVVTAVVGVRSRKWAAVNGGILHL